MSILRRHGTNVVSLDYVHAHKSTFHFIRTYCPLVQSLSLRFDNRSPRITYLNLEEFFLSMLHLKILHIRFDASQFSPAMFWSLSQLPKLCRLSIDVFYGDPHNSRHYPPDAYMTILDCCPSLDDFTVYGQFLEPIDSTELFHKTSFIQWIRKKIQFQRENAPSTPHEAIASPMHLRSLSRGSTISRLRRSSKAKNNHIKVPLNSEHKIKKLELRSPRMDDRVFSKLVSCCPLLEELTIDGLWARISAASWQTLSAQCPRLRCLTVRDSGVVHYLPSIPSLLTLFPQLESLTLMSLEFKADPDLSTLGIKLREIEQQTGDRHPLKHIHFSGSILRPIKLLLDILTQSSTVESLSVGFTFNTLRVLQNEPDTPYDFNKEWLCYDSLHHLDLTSIWFKNRDAFKKFFIQVQRLTRLKSLWISVCQLREARSMGSTGRRRSFRPLDRSLSSADNNGGGGSSSNSNNNQVRGSGRRSRSFFSFSTVETIRIGTACYQSKKISELPIVYDEVVDIIEAAPMLKQLELTHMSESGTVKRLSLEYAKIKIS
ncbi:hypothetical protein BGZ80_005514 [Entomortierella chlamydospora]|uniref:F-box domain protein n=1 Tax=Entomortierella chlamydospora TaxID=101097 RepID=A0A9P6MJG5_9FUNG|nr:hypothetical protein BGZ80_005514 [Entomortierella chlamydospora]